MNYLKDMIDRLAKSLRIKVKTETPQTPAESASASQLGVVEGPAQETH